MTPPSNETTLREEIRNLPKTVWSTHSEYPNVWQVDIEELVGFIAAHDTQLRERLLKSLPEKRTHTKLVNGEYLEVPNSRDKAFETAVNMCKAAIEQVYGERG